MYIKYRWEYSQQLIRTLKGPTNLFELANVQIIGQILLRSDVNGTKKFVRIREVRVIGSSN